MKAILTVDEIPNACVDCPLADRDRIVECCFVTGTPIINTFDESEEELVRNKDCPLKPIPTTKQIENLICKKGYGFMEFDEILDEILRGEE